MTGHGTSYRTGWLDWRADAACRGMDSELFFPLGNGPGARAQAEEAKAVCATCPVRTQCLEWALDTDVKFGIFGGLDEDERHRRRRARLARLSKARKAAR